MFPGTGKRPEAQRPRSQNGAIVAVSLFALFPLCRSVEIAHLCSMHCIGVMKSRERDLLRIVDEYERHDTFASTIFNKFK
jgi:hypothetical protein